MRTILRIPIQRLDPEKTADVPLPRAMSTGAAGMDVFAAVEDELILEAGETKMVPTGFAVAIPEGYEAQIRPRSGLALKHGIGILNSPGTIDSDYRGEVGIIITNLSKQPFSVKRGDRIAQMVICPVASAAWDERVKLPDTHRGEGGFGHTGV